MGAQGKVDNVSDPPTDVGQFNAIVFGAGISGLVATSILQKEGCQKILVIDEYDHVGGNHIDVRIGDYTFDVGSFIFQDDSPLLIHLPELLRHYVEIRPSWGRLNPQGVVTKYPISIWDDIIVAGPVEWIRILSSVAFARLFRRKLRNARDFAQYWIGARLLHRSGLGQYMERFYGLPADKIDIKFAEKRMQWIKEHASFRNPFRRWTAPEPNWIPNKQLARPRNGFTELYKDAIERLTTNGATFLLGTKVANVEKKNGCFVLYTSKKIAITSRVISTIPLYQAEMICGIKPVMPLNSVTLISLFFSFSGDRGFEQAILYNFSLEGAWKRLTVYSDFYGLVAGREYFTVEVNADHIHGSAQQAAVDFRRHTADNGLFAGDLRLEGSHTLSSAYPIYTDNASEKAENAIARLRVLGVESIGRQGAFDYQPTARDTTLKAEAALR
jgi:hypothetical protein